MPQEPKDYSSISPSAKSLLLMKGYTNIPYAREMAAMMQGSEIFDLNFDDKDFWFWMRVLHFENRYWTIDQLLKHAGIRNILELSSGYSLRGLDLCLRDENICYIDTDLPEVVATKRTMIDQLHPGTPMKGRFELQPLDAMDETAFARVAGMFDDGPLTIVNEGLLMYLDMEEKKRLCGTIHGQLQQRGGCWITADIYIQRSGTVLAGMPQSRSEAAFYAQHQMEENKFVSYDAARAFFEEQSFDVVEEAVPDYASLSVMPNLLKVLPEELRNRTGPPPKIQATWMLRPR